MSRIAWSAVPSPAPGSEGSPWPFLAAVLGLILTAVLCMVVYDQSNNAAVTRFDAVTRDVLTRLDQRIDAYAQILRGGAGLAVTRPDLDRDTWAQYYRSLEIPRRFPGVQTFLWVPVLGATGAAAFEHAHRQRGHPDFRIWTREHLPPVTTIALVEPFAGVNRKALGFDMFSDPTRRAAMMRARDTGQMSITGNVTLVIDDRPLAGFVMYVPVFQGGADPGEPAARRDRLIGFVASAFRVEDLLHATLAHRAADLRVRVYGDTGTRRSTLMHDTNPVDEEASWLTAAYRHTTPLRVGGRTWTVAFDSTPAFEARVADNRATLVAIAGVLLSALAAWAASLAVSLRRRTAVLSALAESLARHQADLERANTALTSARDAALDAARAKSAFLANMSHEIRTPIHGFLGHTELALGNPLDPQTRSFLETARDCGRALLGVINDILDFSKLEADRFELDRTDFEPRAVLLECARTVALTADEHGIVFMWSADPDVPDRLSGDPKRLRQILLNLLSNAVKFTKAGEVELSVSVAPSDATRHRLTFSVRDTGIGMSEDTRGRLFQAFYQADASITREFGGTGLGLAISARIAKLMGGQLEAESEPGTGSVFRFSADFAPAATVGTRPVPAQRRALVLDPHPRRAAATGRLLSALGLDSTSVESIDAALAIPGADMVLIADRSALASIADEGWQAWRAGGRTAIVCAGSSADRETFDRARALGIHAVARPLDPAQVANALASGIPSPLPASASASSGGAGRSVLVAEDNPVNRALIARMLERLGQRITLTENGVEAVTACETGEFDVVLMDIQMPEMDGLEASRRIRALEGTRPGSRRTPIFALTADTLPGDRERCLDAGMDGHLAKPLSMDQLRAALESVDTLRQAA